jgi:hypothetical protein
LPPLHLVNAHKAEIEFEVGKVGPSGLGSVDVFVTNDEGATWAKTTSEPDVSLPVVAGAEPPLCGSVTVELPKDATIYGFYLVVKSKAGLGKAPPEPGTPPQVRIEADTILPDAKLYKPEPAPETPGALLLTWKVDDRNMDVNPVTLEWAAEPKGPWQVIGESRLPNTGRYVWLVSKDLPATVYLKLTARDSAGNVAVAQTPEPVLIDLSEPGPVVIKKVRPRH